MRQVTIGAHGFCTKTLNHHRAATGAGAADSAGWTARNMERSETAAVQSDGQMYQNNLSKQSELNIKMTIRTHRAEATRLPSRLSARHAIAHERHGA